MQNRIVSVIVLVLGVVSTASTAGAAEKPDFAKASQVRDSLAGMVKEMKAVPETRGWQTRRAIGMCEDALDRLEDRRTSNAYTQEAGQSIWQSCQGAYNRARTQRNPFVQETEGAEDQH
jgi:hypothetical protein